MYWSHFGLDRQPFRAAVDADSYFPSPTHEEALAAIAAGFARRDLAVLIDGGAGVGKSLVARKWLEHLLPEVPRIVVPNTHAEGPTALLQSMLFDLGKPYQGMTEQELRLSITDLLLTIAAESNYPTVMLLDEAQHLSPLALEELRTLGNLETARSMALFTVLVAQPTLREALRRTEYELISQRIAVKAGILPLTGEESADYLRHQVRAAGGEPDKLLEADLIALLAGACAGIPRILNRAAALAMELAANARAQQVDIEAGLEALQRLGLQAEPEDGEDGAAVLLPHPLRAAEPTVSESGKTAERDVKDEDAATRIPKDRASRKRSV